MTGSAKQIAWAEDIKNGALAQCDRVIKQFEENYHPIHQMTIDAAKEIKSTLEAGFAQIDDAKWYINNRANFTSSSVLDQIQKLGLWKRNNK